MTFTLQLSKTKTIRILDTEEAKEYSSSETVTYSFENKNKEDVSVIIDAFIEYNNLEDIMNSYAREIGMIASSLDQHLFAFGLSESLTDGFEAFSVSHPSGYLRFYSLLEGDGKYRIGYFTVPTVTFYHGKNKNNVVKVGQEI